MTAEPTVVWDVAAELGEGPVWAGQERALYFVDIKRRQVHRFAPGSGSRASWRAPEQIGFLFPAESGGFIAGLQSGLHHFDPASGAFTPLAEIDPDLPSNRLNDGTVDPSGRLWFGTMDDRQKARSGAFYSFAEGELAATGIAEIPITNGPAVSPDGRTLYVVDTLKGTIDAADIGEGGSVGNRRPFARIDPADGHPDGPTVDSAGFVWVALYGGWQARRYSPAGDLVDHVRFPVANITKIAFGGGDFRTAYATTARQQLSEREIAEQPQAGHLFAFPVSVPGLPCPRVRC